MVIRLAASGRATWSSSATPAAALQRGLGRVILPIASRPRSPGRRAPAEAIPPAAALRSGRRRAARSVIAGQRMRVAANQSADLLALARRRVKPQTALQYEQAAAAFCAFARRSRLRLDSQENRDEAMVRFLSRVFENGDGIYTARTTLFGYAFSAALNLHDPKELYLARLTLRGFNRCAPGDQRDPMPWEALLLVVNFLWKRHRASDRLIAQGLLVLFDGYLRLNELLQAKGADVTVLVNRASLPYHRVALTIAPAASTQVDAWRCTTKSGEFADTVIFGDQASVKGHRGWVSRIVENLKNNAGDTKALLPVSHAAFERAFAEALKATSLTSLRTTPHCCRHGAPSTDFALSLRSLAEIGRRGRWKAPASIRRYEKAGRLNRQLGRMTKSQLQLASTLAKTLPTVIAPEPGTSTRPSRKKGASPRK